MTTSTTQREKLEAKEMAILSAAHSEFAEQGFEGAKMASIAKRASVAEGTVYLYYRNKAELLEAVVARFWTRLTEGAKHAVSTEAGSQAQLAALARYHLVQVMGDFDFVGLTSQVRQHQRSDASLSPIRDYVRVFDRIFDLGQQRGEIDPHAVRWQWRDLFYGQLEYSARTLILRESRDTDGVVAHLMNVINTALIHRADGTASEQPLATERTMTALTRIDARLSAIEAHLNQ